MKKFILIIFILSVGICYSQQLNISEANRFNKFIDNVNSGEKKLNYSDIKGSPFTDKNFQKAKTEDGNIIPVRYNSFTDQMEYFTGIDIYILPVTTPFKKFVFEGGKKEVIVYTTSGEIGYYFELVSGKNRLLKKVRSNFKNEIPSNNTYVSSTPARFEMMKPRYFILNDNQIIEIPKNIKDLLSSYSNNQDLENFIKKNKIKSNQEEDLIKLVLFLNTENQ